jgi:hypothetical protein
MPNGTGGQGEEQAWLGVEALRQIRADVTEDRRERLECRPIRKRTNETVEAEGAIVNVHFVEGSAIAAAHRRHPKPAIPHGENEGNSQMMILTSDVKQVRGHSSALLFTLRDGEV